MLLDGGIYKGKQIIKYETIARAVKPVGYPIPDATLMIPMHYSEGMMMGGPRGGPPPPPQRQTLLFSATMTAKVETLVKLSLRKPVRVTSKRIWDKGAYNAFTDLTRYRDQWFCCFREGISHAGDDGKVRVLRSTDGQAAVWAGAVDDLWSLGKPVGVGGPWKDTAVVAGAPSDPYLLTGYDQKSLTLSHNSATPVRIRVEVDLTGTGHWVTYRDFTVPPGKRIEHAFPAAYQAYWLRVVADTPTTATAWLTYN